ncbi:MAG: SusD/RagB family nutrient-binding outer membrane lipoprotein [Saprospiraceae bacterium]|nr:SusD/RagB family nutrient-binding outer membrane lipoprotein [Saprospiraceae bacterium]
MKKAIFFLTIISFLTACDKDFEEMNTNPTAANDIEAKLLFSTALLQGAGDPYQSEGPIMAYTACFVQHIAAVTFNWEGDKYFYNAFHNDVMFNGGYKQEVKSLVAVLDKVKDDPAQSNLYAAARIWEAVVFQRLTDLYGDVPHSEAGRGFIDSNFKPVYDRQQDIYLDLLAGLEAATTALDASKPFIGDADFIFHGDVEKWRRFGNTMMLRLALRLVKADPAAAEAWAKKAIAGGVMQALDDSALVPHSEGDILVQNGIGYFMAVEDNGRLCKTFVNWMKAANDPRLPVLSFVATGGEPKGLPNGLDLGMLTDLTGDTTVESYSRINPALVQRWTPTMMQCYAEAELMLAEAAVRGWSNDDPAVHYQNGVRAAMQQLALFDASAGISDTDIDSYLAAHPFAPANTEAALEHISTQYWAATFLNELEAFANWRRSGYPVLTPSNFPGNATGGVIPRRLKYPQAEFSVNGENINAAIARQGTDDFLTRVWWDK